MSKNAYYTNFSIGDAVYTVNEDGKPKKRIIEEVKIDNEGTVYYGFESSYYPFSFFDRVAKYIYFEESEVVKTRRETKDLFKKIKENERKEKIEKLRNEIADLQDEDS